MPRFMVLGNSLVRRMGVQDVEIEAIPGLDFQRAVRHLVAHRDRYRDAIVFIVIGPLRFSSILANRREAIFSNTHLCAISQLFEQFFGELSFLRITPIVCPLFPMDFQVYNESRCRRPIMTAFYPEWNVRMRGHIVVENRAIFAFNTSHRLITPNIHRRLFHRTRGHYTFRVQHTLDGLHIRQAILTEWAREFRRVMREMTTNLRR